MALVTLLSTKPAGAKMNALTPLPAYLFTTLSHARIGPATDVS